MRAFLLRGACVLGVVGTFASATALGVSLHANTPAVRRLASDLAGRLTADVFAGALSTHDVESLVIGRTAKVRVRDAEMTDPRGVRVLQAHEVEATIDLGRLLRSLARGKPADVALDGVTIERAEVVLDTDTAGTPWIAQAFAGKPTAAASQTGGRPTSVTKTAGPRVVIDHAAIGHAWVHGNLVPPALDGDADDLAGSFRLENDRIAVSLERSRVTLRAPKAPPQRVPLVAAAHGELGLDLAGTGGITTRLHGKVDLDGNVGSVPLKAHAELRDERVAATIDVPRTEPAAFANAFGETLPLAQPVEVHAKVEGLLPALGLSGRVRVGESEATLRGDIDLREGNEFKLEADATRIDAQALGAPVATDLSGHLSASGNLSGGAGRSGTFRLTTTEGRVATEKIPATTIEGRFDAKQVTAVLRAREPGVDANGRLTLDVATQKVAFDLQARSESLRALARAPNTIGGAATARAQGTVDLEKRTIHATTTASVDNIAVDAFSAQRATAAGVLDGPLDAPVLEIGFGAAELSVKANGKPLTYPRANGRAKIAFAPTPRLLDAAVELGQTSGPQAITASSGGIRFDHGRVEVRSLRVGGLGAPLELEASVGASDWHVRAKSSGLELRRAAGLVGIKELAMLPEDTRAEVDVDLRHGGGDPGSGHVDVVVRSEKGIGAGPVRFETHATVSGGKLVGTSKLAAEGFGHVEIASAEIDVPARLDRRSLERATGVLEIRGAVDLSQGAALFAGESVERVSGLASFEARIERRDPAALPLIRGTARTSGLEVALSGEPPAPTIEIKGVDVLGHVAWDGSSDDAEVSVVSWDEQGVLGSAGAKAKVPLATWLASARKIDRSLLADLNVNALADFPTRDVSTLPAFLAPPPLRGRLDAHAEVSGTVAHPKAVVSAHAQRLRLDRRKVTGTTTLQPVDGTLEARWDGERAALTFAFDERERRTRQRADPERAAIVPAPTGRPKQSPGHLRGLVILTDLRASDLLDGKPLRALPWHASAEAEVENLPLSAIPASTTSTRMSGLLTGRASVRDVNRAPSFEAKAHVAGFGTGGAKVQSVDVTAGGRDGSLFAHASVQDRESQATIQLASNSLRLRGLEVSWDDAAPTRLDYAVQNGRLALLGPLLKSSVSEIDGRVDGTGSVTIDHSDQVFEGGLAVQGARLYVNLLGEEISSLDAIARFERSGTFRIDDANGKMGGGEFRASANGRMKGRRFEGAEVTLIATKDGVPLSSEGATFASATGEAKMSMKMSPDRKTLLVDMNVPHAEIDLPDTTQTLQSLDPDPTVTIGVRRRNGKLDTAAVRRSRGGTGGTTATRADEALDTRLDVVLGENVHLEGRGLNVSLSGRTRVDIDEELDVTGRIELRGGTVEVYGRRFIVDRGTVTFPEGGDPTNPTVYAEAHWDAPDRTKVKVSYAAPLKGGKPVLSSEPALAENEILSLLLFGRVDPNQAPTAGGTQTASKQQGGDSTAAVGAAAGAMGFFAADVNRALSEVDLDFETDTLSGNRLRQRVGASFFDRKLKVQVGIAPGRVTYRDPDTTYVFLNWQFVPKWSLLATGGNTGTTILDVLFQHRY